jgi:hypothetical protein
MQHSSPRTSTLSRAASRGPVSALARPRSGARRAGATLAWLSLSLTAVCTVAAAAAELGPRWTTSADADWSGPAWRWRRVPLRASGQGEGLTAVAAEAGPAGRVAIGDLEGVSLREPSADGGPAAFEFAARVAGVTDLAFAPDGTLWIASLSGLFALSRGGELSDRAVAPGELARSVRRVVVAGSGLVAVATEAGAFASLDGRQWRRLADGLPDGPVATLTVRDGERADEAGGAQVSALWVVVGVELWRLEVGRRDGRFELAHAERIVVPGVPAGVPPNDVAVDLPGAGLALVFPQALAVLGAGLSRDLESFRIVRPVLPPGATARRLVAGAGRLWLATDQGLLRAASIEGPWRRAEAPAGTSAILALAPTSTSDGMLAASLAGLLHGAPVLIAAREEEPAGALPGLAVPRDPDIRAVHAASLRYLDLGPGRMRKLWAGAEKRGWLPSVSLRVGANRDRAWARTDDQAFVSGETRYLHDRDEDDALDLDAALVLTWDLADLAYDSASIEVSREHRLIVSLRDNVTDEINQLYFERRALLERLRLPGADEAERRALALRAEELAAGLDAWTGGWFSSARQDPRRPSAEQAEPVVHPIHPPPGPGPNPEDS